jgi:hypothetical protein
MTLLLSLAAFGQGSWFKRGITVGETGDRIDTITVDADAVTFKSGVNTHVLGAYLAGSGIYLLDNTFYLGGAITQDLSLTNNGSTYNMFIQGANSATSRSSRFRISQGTLTITSYENSSYNSTNQTTLFMNGPTASLSYDGVISSNTLTVNSSGVIVDAALSGRGLTGNAYYGASIQGNDYTQKTYVDGLVTEAISWSTCPYNDTTDVVIGSTTTDVSFYLHYTSERNTGGFFQVENGTIYVVYNNDNGNVAYHSEYVGVDNGFDIEADVSGTDIRLNIIVDNSIANNLSFDWKLISKFTQ